MRAAIWAVYMSLCTLCGLSAIFSDHRGVVQALNKNEVGCSSAGHKDADLWMLVWNKVGGWSVQQKGGLDQNNIPR